MKLPNLDDRTFEELVDDAKKLISRYAPEWTDHNIHDPGITFLELFAWLTEMQQYYLDTITDESYLKFLKLFGVKPYIAEPAKADVSFKTGDFSIEERYIPEGTKLLADNVVFETEERLQYTNLCLEQVISEIDGKYVYYTEANARDGIFYNPFGTSGSVDNKLYLGFSREVSEKLDRLPQSVLACGLYETRAYYDSVKQTLCFKGIMSISEKDRLISISLDEDTDYRNTVEILYMKSREPFANISTLALTFDIFEDYLKSPEKLVHTDETTLKYSWDKPLGELVWEYFTKAENGVYAWCGIEADDRTNMLFKSGRIYFKIPPDIQPTSFPGAKDDFCCIRARVVNNYVLSPKVDRILLNAVQALQKETLVESLELLYKNEHSLIIDATYLSLIGKCILQVQQDELWEDWIPVNDFAASGYNDRHYKLTVCEKNCMLRLEFGDGVHGKKPEQFCKIRLIFLSQEYEDKIKLCVSSGLPGQVFNIDRYPVIQESFRLQAPVNINGSLFWQDYTRVDSLDASTPSDTHYVLDTLNGEIRFGDGIKGLVPAAISGFADAGLRIIALEVGGGEKGNIKETVINKIAKEAEILQCLRVENRRPAAGGKLEQDLEPAKERVLEGLRTASRAITLEDYERLALATPGVRIDRAKAYIEGDSTVVNVVVLPYNENGLAVPNEKTLAAVCCHLNRHRLITTRLTVKAPGFVMVSVYAKVVYKAGFTPDSKRITHCLEDFLSLFETDSGNGWQFGRNVYISEIYEVIEKVDGVDYIENLVLYADKAAAQNSKGDIIISKDELIYSGQHSISVSGPSYKCALKGGQW